MDTGRRGSITRPQASSKHPTRSRFAIGAAPCYAVGAVKIPWPKGYLVALVTGASAACGHSSTAPPPPAHGDGGAAISDARPVELQARPLGLADFTAWQWRERPGQPAFRTARKAEDRGDWAAVVTACTEALAADPAHLEAAWLLAVALGKTGKLDQVTTPLALAGAGDFGKWALASLEQPGLQPYLATAAGQAWRRRVEQDRTHFLEAINHGLVVIAKGDLFAIYEQRWYRLTRTYGAVAAAYISGPQLAYITRGKTSHKIAIGSVDLETGITTHPQEVAQEATQIAFVAKPERGFWIGQSHQKPRLLALAASDHQGLFAATRLASRPTGGWLEIYPTGGVRLHRTPVPNISADWDSHGLASAIRIATSNRVVTVPGQIAGDTIAWSPDRNHLAFVAQISDRCTGPTPNIAAYVVDAATGAATELAHATHGLAVDWQGDRHIAIASSEGVEIRELAGPPQALAGAKDLALPRFTALCEVLEPTGDEPAEPDEDPAEN
jgi:hypothetical protein